MLAGALLLDPPDVLVVDPFDGELGLVFGDGREVAQEIVNGVAVPKVTEQLGYTHPRAGEAGDPAAYIGRRAEYLVRMRFNVRLLAHGIHSVESVPAL